MPMLSTPGWRSASSVSPTSTCSYRPSRSQRRWPSDLDWPRWRNGAPPRARPDRRPTSPGHDPAAGGADVDGRVHLTGRSGHQRRNAAATPASTGMCRPVVWLRSAGAEHEDGVGHVLRQHLALEQGALGVVLAQILLGDAVDRGPLGAPAAGEDARAADHAVGVDAVDLHTVLPELGGQQPDLVGLVGLGGRVGDVVRAGEDRVLAGDVDDVAAEPLLDQHLRRRPGDQERALGHDVVLQVPVGDGGVEQRLGQRESSVVDHEIQAAEGQHVRRRWRPAPHPRR